MTSVSRCWSFSRTGERCEKDAGHVDHHEVTVRTVWADDQAWTPSLVEMTKTRNPVPVVAYPDLPDDGEPGTCFSCGCVQEAHGKDGCKAHSCRTFIP